MKKRLPSILVPWLLLRVVLSLVALGASSARPNTDLEKSVTVWPVAEPSTSWVQRVVLEPWRQWDVSYYEKIAERGYQRDDGTLQFHPLYPLAGRAASFLTRSVTSGLMVINSLCGLLFLVVFCKLAELDLSRDDSRRAAILFLHAPLAFILFTAYSEGMFLLFSALTLLMARRGSWWLAGAAGGLAALTRQQGVFLVIPLAWELWDWCGRDVSQLMRRWRASLSVTLIPAGLLVWLVYRARAFGDVLFDIHDPRTWVYGLLISRDATQVVEEQQFMLPWNALAAAFASLRSSTVFDLVLGSFFVVLFVLGGRELWRIRKSYFLYAGAILLVSFSYNTGPDLPYMGLPRHCLLAFPLFLPVALWARRPRVETVFMGAGFLGMAFLTYCYAAQILWVP